MRKYSVYQGKFICHNCKEEVKESRFYIYSHDLTWMCNNKHLSKVSLNGRGY